MKNITFLFVLISFGSFSQLTVSDFYMDNTTEVIELYTLPFDDSRLIQVERGIYLSPSEIPYIYKMIEITGGVEQSFVIPLCTDMSKPVFLENGILAGAETLSSGYELNYWDGGSVLTFDLNPVGDSYPVIQMVGDEVFVLATTLGVKQLFKFDEATLTIEQVSWELTDVRNAVASFAGFDFFQVQDVGVENLVATYDNQGTMSSISVAASIDSLGTGNYASWRSPIEKNDALYLIQEFYNYNGTSNSTFRVIKIQEDGSAGYSTTTLFEEDQVYGNERANIFEWNGDLYYYRGGASQLMVSTDWQNFQPLINLPTGRFKEHYISENGKLYFVRTLYPADLTDFIEYDNGSFEIRSGGRHLHVINEFDDKIYISDSQWSDTSMLRVLDTQWDNLDSALISIAPHSPVENASVMYQGNFVFLYSAAIPEVLQLNESYLSTNNLSSEEFKMYPNPIPIGASINIESNSSGTYQLMSVSGAVLKTGIVNKGVNIIELNVIDAGVYFFRYNDSTERVVVY